MLSKRSLPFVAGAVLFALIVRLWVLSRFGGSLYFEPSSGDMKFYADWGRLFAAGHGAGPHAFFGLPGYPFLLGQMFPSGLSPYSLAFFQTLADLGTAALIFFLGVWAFPGPRGRIAAGLAALGWIVFLPAQAFALLCMPTTLGILAFWGIVFWSLRTESRSRWNPWVWIGLVIGLAATMVGTILLTLPIPLAAAVRNLRKPAAAGVAALAILGGVAVGTAPCWVHNYFTAGEPVFLSAHGGLNFWIGNHPGSNGYPQMTAGLRPGQADLLNDSIRVAEQAAGRPLSRAEASGYWSARANAYIHEQPGDWLKLLAAKVRNFWNRAQYDDLSVINPLAAEGVLTPGLRFGEVAALALAGLALAWRGAPRSRWIAAAVGLQMAALLPVFVTERYRLAAVPGLLLLAGYGGTELAAALKSREWRRAGIWLAGGIAGTLIVCLPVHEPTLRWLDLYNHGLKFMEARHIPQAREQLERALALAPDEPDLNAALGTCSLCCGDRAAAKRYYQKALKENPATFSALNNLAVIAMMESRWTDAEALLDAALRLEPSDPKLRELKARCLQKLNQP